MAPERELDEVRAAGRVLAEVADEVTGTVQRVHRAIAGRALRGSGPARLLHDTISDAVYRGVRTGISLGGTVLDHGLRGSGLTAAARPFSGSVTGRRIAGIVNGAFGDRLSGPLASTMRVRVDGADVELDRDSLAHHYPAPSPRIVVFLHGLIETEEWWTPGESEKDGGVDFAARLTDELGYSSVRIRYNSGRHVSDNGRELSALLAELVDAWPLEIDQLALVGHSMGGLVARSAVHQSAGQPWVGLVRHLVCLGSPHLGAPLERGANLLGWALRRFDESAPLGELLARRSAGIKDLRYGYLDEADWADTDPDEILINRRSVYTSADGARLSFAAATLGGRAGTWIGDLLVLPDSALDESQDARRRTFERMNHFDLLRHPDVYAQLRDWLTT